ncbi:MAG: MBL fold metallo-hydrolase [Evtepia gabavorous]
MELERVKGNTWVLKSWELIPLYQVDDTRCILLDTGTVDQRAELEAALDQAGLTPVAILGSHAHIDHMGSYGYFQKTRGRPGSDPRGGGTALFPPGSAAAVLQSVPGGLWAVPRAGECPLSA